LVVRRVQTSLGALSFLCVFLAGAGPLPAVEIHLGFSSIPASPNVVFEVGGFFNVGDEVPGTFNDMQIDSSDFAGDAQGLTGDLDGIFTIGPVTSVVVSGLLLEFADVSGVGSMSIRDAGGEVLTADLEWLSLNTISNSLTLNTEAEANLSNFSYSGANRDLRQFASCGVARIQMNGLVVSPARTLSALVADGGFTDEYSGTMASDCCSGRLGDFVFLDNDCDGRQGAGDTGIGGVTVILKDASGNVLATAVTDGNGHYEFTGLCAGDYLVEVDLGTLGMGLVPTLSHVGDPAGDSNASPAAVTLAGDDASDLTIDFGFKVTGSIGDRVWRDLDCDGVQDAGEPGINGVRVELRSADGSLLFASTVTSGDGSYSFDGLDSGACQPAGGYLVVVDTTSAALAGLVSGFDLDGGADSRTRVVLGAGMRRTDVDFGFCPEPPGGGEGCTPGYWKQCQHFDSWPAPYTPRTQFSAVFENAFPGKTLLQVLKQGGGGINALGRHTVAALLNGASSGVDYDLTAAEVISRFNAVFPGSVADYESLKNFFEAFNEQGCPLN
jgi:hypothetical protein